MIEMNAQEFGNLLNELNACDTAKDWAIGKSFAEVWNTCDRGDWLLWLASQMIGKEGWFDHNQIVLAAIECAESCLKYIAKDKSQPKECLDIVRLWIAGKATLDEVKIAASAAYAFAAASATYSAVYAAYASAAYASTYAAEAEVAASEAASEAAAYAAYASASYASAAEAAAYATDSATAYASAAYAAKAAEAEAVVAAARLKTANIVRKVLKFH
jgi:hypothetical protein